MAENKIKIVYFKESGKFYLSSELDILPIEYIEGNERNPKWANIDKIRDRVINLAEDKDLPGVYGNWLQQGHISIDVPEIGYPILILKGVDYSKPYVKLESL